MMLNIQSGGQTWRAVILLGRTNGFDFEIYFEIGTAEMEANDLNMKTFIPFCGVCLSVNPFAAGMWNAG